MSDNRYYLGKDKEVCIRIPKDVPKGTQITITVVTEATGEDTYLRIDNVVARSINNGEIHIKNNCRPKECRDCHVHYCPVYRELVDLFEVDG